MNVKRIALFASIFFVVMIATGYVWARNYAIRRIEANLFRPPTSFEPFTPADSLGVDVFSFPVEDRVLRAAFLDVGDTAAIAMAVLLFHGNGATIGGQLGLQQSLAEGGVSSMVFDYSGFGASSGEPRIANLRRDAVEAYRVFAERVGPTSRKFVMGTSLGAGVILDVIDEIQASVDGVIVIGTFGSAIDLAVTAEQMPRWLVPFIPRVYDNVSAAGRVQKPLLVVHSENDERFSIEGAERIAEAAGTAGRLVRLQGVVHSEYLARPPDWDVVFAFVGGRETAQ